MKNLDLSELVITRIVDVYSYSLPDDICGTGVSAHNALVMRRSGSTEYTVGKKRFCADPNNILFLPAKTEYSMEVEKKGPCIVIEFDCANDPEGLFACVYGVNNAGDILSTAKNILHYWTLKGPAFAAKCLSEMYSIITQIATLDSYANTLAGKYRLIHRSVKYIEANYADPDLYTPRLAEMSGIGETYYRNIFISVFNMPPARYIQQYRVDKAKELIVGSGKSVEEIAVSVGFANASYFCKVFKNLTGLTPLEFASGGRLLG